MGGGARPAHPGFRPNDPAHPRRAPGARAPVRAWRGRGGQRLSYRALDVEQIGHVYEGLLDHTAIRTTDAALGFEGRIEPELSLGVVEAERAKDDDDAFCAWLAKETGRSAKAIAKGLAAPPDPYRRAQLRAACGNDDALLERVAPYDGLLRTDLRGNPVVYRPGAIYVTQALERRSSGTYYTPRALAEEVVRHALDPVAYRPGPAEEAEAEKWRLRPPDELLALKVCDLAMGSGAFLVAACRYLAARLLESWDALGEGTWTVEGAAATGAPGELLVPADELDRDVLAHRLVSDRCLYGVDKNGMAVDMAKLSMWLITMARDRPFSFLDHALREGDSLLGVTDLAQVLAFHINPERGARLHAKLSEYTGRIRPTVQRALELRRELESFTARDVRDAARKAQLHEEAKAALADVRLLADTVVGATLASGKGEALDTALTSVEDDVRGLLAESSDDDRAIARGRLRRWADEWLAVGRAPIAPDRKPFHWPLEFPEVDAQGGFDAAVGNPPFQGGKKITGALGTSYRTFLVEWVAGGHRGNADLVAYFFLRVAGLLREGGMAGLLATNTIGQGETREGGLAYLVDAGLALPRRIEPPLAGKREP